VDDRRTPDAGRQDEDTFMPRNLQTLWLRRRSDDEHGFTLIELLVVVVIIGILIAIAIPLYSNYKKNANDKASQSDLRNAINVLEQCNADNQAYPSAVASTGGTPTGCTGGSIKVSPGTTLAYYPKSSSDFTGYIMSSTNSGGTGKIYCYNSTVAGSVASTTTAVTAYRSAC
jgi:type IV pilus assembly protein PilA